MSIFRLSTRALSAPLRVAARQPQAFTPSPIAAWRSYSASALSADAIKARITDVLHSFEKVDPSKVRSTAVRGTSDRRALVRGTSPEEIFGGRAGRKWGKGEERRTDACVCAAGLRHRLVHQRPRTRLARRRRGRDGH